MNWFVSYGNYVRYARKAGVTEGLMSRAEFMSEPSFLEYWSTPD